jgi:hypothetical protein
MCRARGIITPATIADHVTPHKGDWNAFSLGPLQSLCETCHNSRKQAAERRGYTADVGDDGWPLDPKHPSNTGKLHTGGRPASSA